MAYAEIALQRCDALIAGFEDILHAVQVCRREPWMRMRMRYGLVWRADRPWSPGLADFVATLREVQAETDLREPCPVVG